MFKDVLTSMDLSMAPVVALVGFFLAFVGIGVWLVFAKNSAHFDHMNGLPLQDGSAAPPDGTTSHAADTAFSGGR